MEPKIDQLCPTCLSSARKLGQLGPEADGDVMQVFSIVIAIQTLVYIFSYIFYNTVVLQFLTTGAETTDLQRSNRV